MIRATSSRSSWACHHRLGHGRSAGALSTSAARGYHTRRTTKVSSGLYEGTVERFVTEDEVDTALQHVAQQSEAWHQVSTAERIRILEDIRSRCIKCCIQLGRRGAKVTGYGPPDTPDQVPPGQAHVLALVYTTVLCNRITSEIALLSQLLESAGGDKEPGSERATPPPPPADAGVEAGSRSVGVRAVKPVRKTADGRVVVNLQEGDGKSADAIQRCRGDIYVRPGFALSQGATYAQAHAQAVGGVCCVLGAGNQPTLAFLDTIHAMFHGNAVVCLKYHDAQAELAPIMQYILEPLSQPGFLRAFCCNVPLTQHMLYHPLVSRVRMTGSRSTHDAIVWGTDEAEAQQRKEVRAPRLKVPIESELGSVAPAVVVPGEWAADSVAKVAQLIAYNMLDNAGCNCLTPRVVIISAAWPQADEFEAALRDALATQPAAPLWYPGADARYEAFLEAHPDCDLVQPAVPEDRQYSKPVRPWAINRVDVSDAADAADIPGLREEFFTPAVTLVRLTQTESADAAACAEHAGVTQSFLCAMPEFTTDALWGNLVASVYAPPEMRAEGFADAWEACIDGLQYGSVVVNGPTFVPFSLPGAAWGAFASEDASILNPGSGIGQTGNTRLVDHVEKQVLSFEEVFDVPPTELPAPAAKALVAVLCGGASGLLQAAMR